VEHEFLLGAVPVMIWMKDLNDVILRCNRAAAEATGLSPDAVEGRTTRDVYPEYAERWRALDRGGIETGAPKLGILEEYRRPSGERGWARVDRVPLRDERVEVRGVAVLALDVTEAKRVEADLERSLSLLRSILESTFEGILVVDRGGKIVAYNAR